MRFGTQTNQIIKKLIIVFIKHTENLININHLELIDLYYKNNYKNKAASVLICCALSFSSYITCEAKYANKMSNVYAVYKTTNYYRKHMIL